MLLVCWAWYYEVKTHIFIGSYSFNLTLKTLHTVLENW